MSKNCSFVFLCEETRDNLLNAVAGFSKGSSSERSPISVWVHDADVFSEFGFFEARTKLVAV